MNHELAKTLTTALVQFIDRERPEGTMCCSTAECERLEKAFEVYNLDFVERFMEKKLSGLTEFEQALSNYLKNDFEYFHTQKWDEQKWDDVIRTQSKELFALAKKELARRDEVITLGNLPPYDKGFQDGKAEAMADLERTFECNPDKLPGWLKDELTQKHLEGYIKGRNDALREMSDFMESHFDTKKQHNESVPYHFPIMPTPPSGWGCDGTYCTNPLGDCIYCPKRSSPGETITTPNTASGISTATLHGNTSATDGKEHNPSFTD